MGIAREVTWHAAMQQLMYSPLAEQDTLRVRAVANTSLTLPGHNVAVSLYDPQTYPGVGGHR